MDGIGGGGRDESQVIFKLIKDGLVLPVIFKLTKLLSALIPNCALC